MRDPAIERLFHHCDELLDISADAIERAQERSKQCRAVLDASEALNLALTHEREELAASRARWRATLNRSIGL